MIVDNPDFVCVSVYPPKYDSPLVVDSNGVQAFEVAPQLFQPVRRRNAQIFKSSGDVDRY